MYNKVGLLGKEMLFNQLQVIYYRPHILESNVFVLSASIGTFWLPLHRNFIFGMVLNLDQISFKFRTKVKGSRSW